MEITATLRTFQNNRNARREARAKEWQEKLVTKIVGSLATKAASDDGPFVFKTKRASSIEEARHLVESIRDQVLGELALRDPNHNFAYDALQTQRGCINDNDTLVVGEWRGQLTPDPLPIVFLREHQQPNPTLVSAPVLV